MSTIYKFIIAMVFGFLFGVILLSCNTFEPIIINDQPSQCNDMYTLMKFSSNMTGLFSKENTSAATALTLLTLSWNDCQTARKVLVLRKRFEQCVKIVYGEKLLSKKENYKQYADFADCVGIK